MELLLAKLQWRFAKICRSCGACLSSFGCLISFGRQKREDLEAREVDHVGQEDRTAAECSPLTSTASIVQDLADSGIRVKPGAMAKVIASYALMFRLRCN